MLNIKLVIPTGYLDLLGTLKYEHVWEGGRVGGVAKDNLYINR